eukprot:59976-Pyramimonas_sp.AAC.1
MGSEARAASPIHRRCIGDASAMHWRHRRCIGDVVVENIWPHIEPQRCWISDASAMRRDPPTSSTPTPCRIGRWQNWVQWDL